MSRAGQNTFTGISAQADIALLYLLDASKSADFKEMIIEGDQWEDFSLKFMNRAEHFEVKWHTSPLTYNDAKAILEKESAKNYSPGDIFRIAAKSISSSFREDLEYVARLVNWYPNDLSLLSKDRVVQKLRRKKWSGKTIAFLSRVHLVEHESVRKVHGRILEYFAYEHHYYLTKQDQDSLVARSLRRIMTEGTRGGSITKKDFLASLERFSAQIADVPTALRPRLKLGKRLLNIRQFLMSQKKFKTLNDKTYLTQICSQPRLVFYILDRLDNNTFHVSSFDFLIKKVLLRRLYADRMMHLLHSKWKAGKADGNYMFSFITANYENLFHDHSFDEALNILSDIVSKDTAGEFTGAVLRFFQTKILPPFSESTKRVPTTEHRRGWREKELVARTIQCIYNRSSNKVGIVQFIYQYFDMTGDDFGLVTETHAIIYSILKDFLNLDIKANWGVVIKGISQQFNARYGGRFNGFEISGSGVSQAGDSYSITDKGVVRLLFEPLIVERYQSEKNDFWKLLQEQVLDHPIDRHSPVFLRRALVKILISRITDNAISGGERRKAFDYLHAIIRIKNGIPSTSEVIFFELRNRDLSHFGHENVMQLVEADSLKYRKHGYSAGYPTTIFSIEILVKLIQGGCTKSKIFFLKLMTMPRFADYDRSVYDSFELLSKYDIPQRDPDFIAQVLTKIDLKNYLNETDRHDVGSKGRILTGLIIQDWKEGKWRGKGIIDLLLHEEKRSYNILGFVGTSVRDLAEHNAIGTFLLFIDYFHEKASFQNVFNENSHAREYFVDLAQKLVETNHINEARHIVDICVYDPDPETHLRPESFNYHLEILQGSAENIITTVRGKVPWVLQKMIARNTAIDMKYALDQATVLLDLDGKLAESLGYPEADYYVRLQAIVPLIELAHPRRRQLLETNFKGFGDRVKDISFALLRKTEEDISKGKGNPKAVLGMLVHLFDKFRALSTDKARETLEFFDRHNVPNANWLFVYYAIFRANTYPKIPFDPSEFETKLKLLCESKNVFRSGIALDFWNIANSGDRAAFEKIEEYWVLLFDLYEPNVFIHLHQTLEITLNLPEKYAAHKELLKKAIRKEIEHKKLVQNNGGIGELSPEVCEILLQHSLYDFLDVFLTVLDNLDENEAFFNAAPMIQKIKSATPSTKEEVELLLKIRRRVNKLFPELWE